MTLAPGARLLQYEIVEPLGAGGMGEVYRARDSRLGRDVAIKVLSDHLASDPEMQARFEREARAVAALSHPGILSIHELAQVDGRSVAVMELLQGENLRKKLAHGPLPWREAAELGAQIADALAAAHARGIIHRDLKPENIFVLPDGHPKILDFGLARSKDPLFTRDPDLQPTIATTHAGKVFGTIGYMAPEQVRGEEVDVPADIFALGCMLAEMVTGARAFARPTPAESLAAVLAEPTPDLHGVRGLPPAYADIVTHCLEKDARARFQSAADVALALRSLLSDPEAASSGTTIVVAGVRRKAARGGRSLAVLPFESRGTDPGTEYLADGITESIINSLSQVPKLRVVPRSLVFRYKGREADPRSVALALNVKTLVTGRVSQHGDTFHIQVELINAGSESQLWGHQYQRPVAEVLQVQDEIASRITDALKLKLSGDAKKTLRKRSTSDTDAYKEYLRGRYHWSKWTAGDFRLAIQHFDRAVAQDPAFALAYSGLSDTYGAMGYYGYLAPEVAMPRAKAAATRALQLDDSLAEAHAAMAICHMMYSWKWADAEREFERAIALNPEYAATYTLYALYQVAMGRFDRALTLAKHGAQIDPLSPLAQMAPAWVLYFERRFRESLDYVRQLISVNPEWPETKAVLMLNYEQLGEFERAADAMNHALAGAVPPREVEALAERARLGGHDGYWAARLQLFQLPGIHTPAYLVAAAHGQLGRIDDAFRHLEAAVTARNGQLVFTAVDPALDPLRRDRRYEQVLATLGLPQMTPVRS